MKDLIDLLENPPKKYRGIPFWSWNDKLDSEMLKWQINEMDKVGLGGYFMHARAGLQTEYLSDELTFFCALFEKPHKFKIYEAFLHSLFHYFIV